jgi:hypothetical protein
MIDADRGYVLPPTARLEYEHGDTIIRIEVPPEHTAELVRGWTEIVIDLSAHIRPPEFDRSVSDE